MLLPGRSVLVCMRTHPGMPLSQSTGSVNSCNPCYHGTHVSVYSVGCAAVCGSGVGRMLGPSPSVTRCPTGTTAMNSTNRVSGEDNRASLGTLYHYSPWD